METAICHINTKLKFQSIVPEVVMIVHQDYIDGCKKMIAEHKGKIKEEHTPEKRKDNRYGLVVTGLPIRCFNSFFMLKKYISIPEYTFALTKDIKAEFRTDYKNKYISLIRIEFNIEKSWRDLITISTDKPMSSPFIKDYEINWSAIGSCDAKTAEMFATGMNVAVQLAKECNARFAEKSILTEK